MNEDLSSIKNLVKKVFTLKNDLVGTYDLYFKQEKEQVAFLYPVMNLSWMDLFKIVKGGQLVDYEYVPPEGSQTGVVFCLCGSL